jgi:uncharacterized membrane protein
MKILRDINELVQAGVISNEAAGNIRDYYRDKGELSNNRLFIVFGILGSILVGLGFVLIIAHNWDELSKITKNIFRFSSAPCRANSLRLHPDQKTGQCSMD